MTDDQKQLMMAYMLRRQQEDEAASPQPEFAHNMLSPYGGQQSFDAPPGAMGGGGGNRPLAQIEPTDYGSTPRPRQSSAAATPAQSPNASGAAMSDPTPIAQTSYPTGPGSMATSTPAAEMAAGTGSGEVMATPAAVGGEGAAGSGLSASTFALPAAVLAGFAHLGEEAGVGVEWANDELMEPLYTNLIEKPVKESIRGGEDLFDALKFWEWF